MNRRFAVLVGLALAGGCSGKTEGPNPPSAPKSCTTNADCGFGQQCKYEIGSCAAQGRCYAVPPIHGFVQMGYCGCSGLLVSGGGGDYGEGYAAGPTAGDFFTPACADGGTAGPYGQNGGSSGGPIGVLLIQDAALLAADGSDESSADGQPVIGSDSASAFPLDGGAGP